MQLKKKMFYSTTYAYGKNEFTITIFDVQVVSCKLSVHAATVLFRLEKKAINNLTFNYYLL